MALNSLALATLARHGIQVMDVWLSLHTSDPGDTGEYEVTVEDYARVSPYSRESQLSILDVVDGADPARIENSEEVVFTKTDSNWNLTICYLGCFTTQEGGQWLGFFELDKPVLVGMDEVIRIPKGSLTIELESS